MSQQNRKKSRKINTYYEIREGKLIRSLKKCPRCGSFMAHHKGQRPRWACGSCSFTEFIS